MTKKNKDNTLQQLILLLAIFILGIFSLISIHIFFLNLVDSLDKKTNNLKAKIAIGEYIVNDINMIRSDFYELATTATNKRGREIINNRIIEKVNLMENALDVLRNGGTIERIIRLNVVEHNSITKKIVYKKDKNDISLEVIDLSPKIYQFKQMLQRLNIMLQTQYFYKKNKDVNNFMELNTQIKRFYKRTPAFFIRISENASRLLYEGSLELEELENHIKKQKEYYTNIELAVIFLIVLLSLIIGSIIAFRINKNTKLLKRQESFTRGTLDSQENIVIVSDGEKMIGANSALINFFDNYKNFNEFEKEHKCICDFFEYGMGENLITGKYVNEMLWYEYIILNPEINHRVIMKKNRKSHYFLITATKKDLDNNDSIIIVTLNDITKEIEIQERLKHLNENLEDLVDEKTKELQVLNENLEKRVQQELEENRKKDRTLIQQSRFAALGEMLGNIAHQWRQPLSAISSTVSSMKIQLELNLASKEEIIKSYDSITKYVDFLDQTINDFRGFFRKDKEKVEFNILKKIENSISITSATYKNNSIQVKIKKDSDSYIAFGLPNELTQVFLNILNNAKDILIERKVNNRIVFIEISQSTQDFTIEIFDNAGGVDEEIIPKIFDPYFTTKHKSQGTGIGLYMSKYIIEKNMNGELGIENKHFKIDDEEYYGACFKIKLPKI
jgi:signal transduction histidine kinase